MNRMMGAIALTMVVVPAMALAQSTGQPDVSSAPSAQNSGTGIQGQPGNKNGPALKPGETVGSTAGRHNSTVQSQDPSNIKGLPGNKSGEPAKPSSPR